MYSAREDLESIAGDRPLLRLHRYIYCHRLLQRRVRFCYPRPSYSAHLEITNASQEEAINVGSIYYRRRVSPSLILTRVSPLDVLGLAGNLYRVSTKPLLIVYYLQGLHDFHRAHSVYIPSPGLPRR